MTGAEGYWQIGRNLCAAFILSNSWGDMQHNNVKLVCAWCGDVLSGSDSAPVSHGICIGCYKRVEASFKLAGNSREAEVDETAETVAMSRETLTRQPMM